MDDSLFAYLSVSDLGVDYMSNFSPVGELKFCCDHDMTNFSPGEPFSPLRRPSC